VSDRIGRSYRRRPANVAVRFGGAITGVGVGAGVLYLVGADGSLLAAVVLLLTGIALLVIGWFATNTAHG
jgi:hypothetical protein